jgi:lipid-A-disaccharide synthase-like uncharacterized protein
MASLFHKILEILFDPWVLFGLFGQFVFFSRVFVQWIASERKKAIVVPISYWRLSIAGAIILFVYAVHRRDTVFIIAYVLNVAIFWRSLVIHTNQKKREQETGHVVEPGL